MESFDVTALYTNVSNDSAMEAVFELLNQHAGAINMYGFSINQALKKAISPKRWPVNKSVYQPRVELNTHNSNVDDHPGPSLRLPIMPSTKKK
ncbi:unnamed protein product [Heligmosomoides polygyrus]|uniref:Reverse transcriptase domain-containing protein n=1 Tax=Heligmosomoides polygyrus TaxID=6339 RepID=A0A183FY37_HELPZ|nr:unnamed protein product [Heligmosomoides polygyrus]